MSGTNPVGSWALPLSTGPNVQDPTTYKGNIDADFAVAQRVAALFAPRPADPPAMSIAVDGGFIDSVSPAGRQTVIEVAPQMLSVAAAPPSPDNRIDLVVIDAGTGVASIVAGTAAGAPVAPAIPAGRRQIAQISVPNGTMAIGAANITDLRASWGAFARGIPFCIAGGSADALTGAFTPATPALGAASDGYLWRVRALSANASSAPRFAPDGQGPWTIVKSGASPLAPGDIAGAGAELLLGYNDNGGSPYIELLNPAPSAFTTGDVKTTYKTAADPGWVMMDDGTIGDASSGATNRANADTQALFTLLWNNVADAYCSVSGGRGASASTDFLAHKTIGLPKVLGRAFASAGAGSGLTPRGLGGTFGDENLQAHSHGVNDPGHLHGPTTESFLLGNVSGGGGVTGGQSPPVAVTYASSTASATTGISIQTAGSGNSQNLQPTTFMNLMIKL